MTVRDLLKEYNGKFAEYEVFAYTSRFHKLAISHLDDVNSVYDESYYLDKEVVTEKLMDEEEYDSFYESSLDVNFEEWYGDENAKVLFIILSEDWNKEEEELKPVTDEKEAMAETLISLPGYDGEKDIEWLCKHHTAGELRDILDAYEIEFSDPEYDDTELELTKNQHISIYSAQQKYDKANTKKITLKLNKSTDADILAWLDSTQNMQGSIKEAIRTYLSR